MREPSLGMQNNKEGFSIHANHQTCIPSNGPVCDGEEETLARQARPLFSSHTTLTRSSDVKILPYYAGNNSPERSWRLENPSKETLYYEKSGELLRSLQTLFAFHNRRWTSINLFETPLIRPNTTDTYMSSLYIPNRRVKSNISYEL